MMKNIESCSPVLLVILDGLGFRPNSKGNAVHAANMSFFKSLIEKYPTKLLKASGQAVGLLPGFMGNSEVGHKTLGSGRIIKSALVRFKESIDSGRLFEKKVLTENLLKLKNNVNSLHLMGLLSDGGVHSHEFQLHALLQLAKKQKVNNVYIHVFLDGRDVPPKSAAKYLERLEKKIKELGIGEIASIHGRFYAMDRDENWQRTKASYDILCNSKIKPSNLRWDEVLSMAYDRGLTDEFVFPTLLIRDGQIMKGDGVIFFNFRADRARQLTEAFVDPNFSEFEPRELNSTKGTLSFFITTTRYKKEFTDYNNDIIFYKEKITNTLLDVIPYKKFIIAETEKYAHVTYFFRGMEDKKLKNEERILVPSIKTKNYINNPEMSAQKITNHILNSLKSDPACFYLINYANADMVGHSGDFDATVKACQFLDLQIESLYEQVVEKQNGTIFITSDHGNAEEMVDLQTGTPKTAHTSNPVYFIKVNKDKKGSFNKDVFYGLSNVAATIIKHLQLKVPEQMDEPILF